MKEGLSPARSAVAVFVGCFVGVVPIYGFQSVLAIGLAVKLNLNKPLTFAATFVNNPFLQPFLVVASILLGHLLLYGRLVPLNLFEIRELGLQQQLGAWLVGSVALGLLLASAAASCTYAFQVLLRRRKGKGRARTREGGRFGSALFASCRRADRNFVKWKLRLDRIFPMLMQEDPGVGPVVDLGCGFGIVLGLVGHRSPGRRLVGCDLDERRIDTARRALAPLKAELSVSDVRTFEFPSAGLILIIDVLQYLNAEEQLELLRKCYAWLLPGGKLVFRVPDNTPGRFTSRLSIAFDGLVFRLHRTETRPTVMSPAEYRLALQSATIEIREQRFVNWIPFAHVLFTVSKPIACGE